MNASELKRFVEFGRRVVDVSSALIREYNEKPFHVEVKGDRSPVTSVDQIVEDQIREMIAAEHPDHGILGEERKAYAPDSEFVWVLDPIDGTLPFLAGIPVFGTLLALLHNGAPVLGIIDIPMTGERWVGAEGLQTTRNDKPVHSRPCADLSKALMSTSNPDYYDHTNAPALERLKKATRFAVYGGSCMFYAQIASGRVDICIDVQFAIWDYLALVPVIQGAGGVLTNWEGHAAGLHSGDRYIAAGDPRTHEQALKILAGGKKGDGFCTRSRIPKARETRVDKINTIAGFMENKLLSYKPIADAIAKLLHPYAEVVIHDIEKDTVAHIANAYSGRAVGDKSHLGLDSDKSDFGLEKSVHGPYEKPGNNGEPIRSITAVLRDEEEKPIGIICINLDFSPLKHAFESASEVLNGLISPPDTEARPEVIFRDEWQEQIKLEIRAFCLEKGRTRNSLNVKDRRELMQRLDQKRLFYARKSVEQVAGLLKISRATAYKDLNRIRESNKKLF